MPPPADDAGASDIWSDFRAVTAPDQAAALRTAELEALRQSGLFMPETYRAMRGPDGPDPLADYHDHGWRIGCWPNPYFDPAWYATEYPDVASLGTDPLLHYIGYGEQEGRRPVAWFDPAWYRAHHPVPPGMHALRHFLIHRADGTANPNDLFDSAWYLATYPDVAAVGMDPMEHYRVQGFREGRDPSPRFDTRFYRLRYLAGRPDENPLLHYLRHRTDPTIHPRLPDTATTIAREVRRATAPGPAFEDVVPLPPDTPRRAMVLAFYLPQFHPIPQNDTWWGNGFTEWTNTARALPRFAGHYQPRIPRDLGHYRLDDPSVLPRQLALAQGAGLTGFVFYYYWFDRQRLLERPLEAMLADPSIDCPFCLMWANESWSRRWDGSEQQVLIAQSYAQADEPALLDDFARHFADPRYIRLEGRPLLMIYRAGLIPDTAATIARWRADLAARHNEHPLLVMAQSFGEEDPGAHGFDAAVEFPPHKLVRGISTINTDLDPLDHEFTAQVYAYTDLAATSLAEPTPAYPLIRTAIPGWDNDARRQGRGLVVHGANPDAYQAWLAALVQQARARPFRSTPLVCINAWNEWAEGAYLEPDQHFGAAFLNATGRAITGPAGHAAAPILLVGHDAFAAGAQLLLLHIARQLRAAHGVHLHIALCGDGSLADAYRATAPLTLITDEAALHTLAATLRREGCRNALVNSAAAAWCCPILQGHGIVPVLLVHEMPLLLAERALIEPLRRAIDAGTSLVFAADPVRRAVTQALSLSTLPATILPQGLYQPLACAPAAAASLRDAWGIPPDRALAIGLGYADLRKGFDLFLQVFRLAPPDLHMVWVGAIDPDLRTWLAPDIAAAHATGRFHLAGWQDNPAAALHAADLLLLTSREDGYPSIALEALACNTAIVAFDNTGGIPALLRDLNRGAVVPMADCAAMAARIPLLLATPQPGPPPSFPFPPYAAALLRLLLAALPSVSVIVSCYRQAAFLPRRLAGIFAQTVPIHAVELRDDASDDNSPDIAADIAASAGRLIDIVVAPTNAGTPFAAWRDAVANATGDIVWIAEADDDCEPDFLARLLPAFADPTLVMAASDSHPVAPDGSMRPESYRHTYEQAAGPGALSTDTTLEGPDFVARYLAERNVLFNVSAVLFRRTALLAALDRLGKDLLSWHVAGDWRLYVELLLAGSRIAFVASPLNLHCRAAGTASARLSASDHLAEITRIHRLLRERLGNPPGLAARQSRYRKQASQYLSGQKNLPVQPD